MRDQAINKGEFSPNAVSNWFSVPRTTLFRWEAQKLIPEAKRNDKGERVFKRYHLKKIADVVRERIRNQMRQRPSRKPTVSFLYRTSEQLHIANFFSGSDSEKLRDLQWLKNAVAVQELSDASIDALWEEATQRPVGDKVRVSIADLIYRNEESAQQRKNDKR